MALVTNMALVVTSIGDDLTYRDGSPSYAVAVYGNMVSVLFGS
jgi:hypothetical protein